MLKYWVCNMPKKENEKNKRKTHLIKNKGLRRVCAVVCLCFALFAVALPLSRSPGNLTVSAANNTALYPDDSIIIYTDYNPSFLVTWTARNVTTLAYSPRFVISSGTNDFGLIVGDKYVKMVSTDDDNEALGIDVPFYNCSDGSNSRNPTPEFGFTIKCRAFLGKDFNGNNANYLTSSGVYAGVVGGEYTLGDFSVYNCVQTENASGTVVNWNYALYTLTLNPVYSSGVQRFAKFYLYRVEDTIPLNETFIFDSSKSTTNFFNYNYDFTGVIGDNDYYNKGYNVGYSKGYGEGYDLGDKNGFSRGDETGYNRGLSEQLSKITPWQYVVDGVNSFLGLEILPNVKLSVILSVAFGCILLGFAIKIFLGG